MKSTFPKIITSIFLITLFSPFVVSAEKVHLTNNDYDQKDPDYSSDGTKIVYSSEEDGEGYFDIWVMNADGTSHIQITNQQYDQINPIWSPDGQRIAYSSNEDGDVSKDLWIMNADGTQHTQLVSAQGDGGGSSRYNHVYPSSFSPDGSRIVYYEYSYRNTYDYGPMKWVATHDYEISSIRSDGSGDRVQLTSWDDFDASHSTWSPDGNSIVFSSRESDGYRGDDSDNGEWDLWKMNSDGGGRTQLTYDGAMQTQPMFNAQGDRIVYVSYQDGGDYSDIWIMKPDGSNQMQLTTQDNIQSEPSFNDDGSIIVYESDEDGLEYIDIWSIDYTPPPNQSPSVSVNAEPTSGAASLTVSFSGSGYDSDGSIVSYSWDFGDGASSTEQNPSHTYQNVGSFTAILTVTDDEGATNTASIEIVVDEPEDNQPPNATAEASAYVSTPRVVSFTGSGSDSDGSIASYSWDFGDGTSSTEQNPSHTYQNAGTFTVTLTVTDDDGATDTSTILIDTYGNENGADADSTSEGEGTSNTPGFSVLVAISAICVAATTINSRKKRRLNKCDDINSV